MIDPAQNMWLNEDNLICEYTPYEDTSYEDTSCKDTSCEDASCEDASCEDASCEDASYENAPCEVNCTINLTSSRSSISSTATGDTNELLYILLGAVEKLTAIVLEEKPVQSPAKPLPTPQKTAQPPPQMVSTPTLKTNNEWVKVRGKSKPGPKTTGNTIESNNMFNLLASIPTSSAESDNESPKSTWADSPIPNVYAQKKQPQHDRKSNQRRPAAVVSKFPERNSTWKATVPGNSSFSDIVQHGKKAVLFSDSICNRFSEWELNQKSTNCRIKKKSFPGATASDLAEHHMHPYLKKNLPDVAVIHAGANDIFQLGGKEGGLTDDQINTVCGNILTCGMICKEYGVNKVTISSVLPGRSKKFTLSSIFINNILEQLCEEVGFDFIRNANISYEIPTEDSKGLFYRDGLHLNDDGRKILMQNFIDYLNTHD